LSRVHPDILAHPLSVGTTAGLIGGAAPLPADEIYGGVDRWYTYRYRGEWAMVLVGEAWCVMRFIITYTVL